MLTHLRRARLVRRVVTPLVLLSTLLACHSWSPVEIGPRLPDHVLVTPAGPDREVSGSRGAGDRVAEHCPRNRRFELYSPVVVGDTLRGYTTKESRYVEVAVPVSGICRVETRRVDALKTIAAVIGPLVVLGAAAGGAATAGT